MDPLPLEVDSLEPRSGGSGIAHHRALLLSCPFVTFAHDAQRRMIRHATTTQQPHAPARKQRRFTTTTPRTGR
jgi:hypothetical protein